MAFGRSCFDIGVYTPGLKYCARSTWLLQVPSTTSGIFSCGGKTASYSFIHNDTVVAKEFSGHYFSSKWDGEGFITKTQGRKWERMELRRNMRHIGKIHLGTLGVLYLNFWRVLFSQFQNNSDVLFYIYI